MNDGSFEDQHLLFMQQIEKVVIDRYRAEPELVDHNVDKVYEAIMREYQAELKEKNPPKLRLTEIEQTLYDEVRPVLEIERRHSYDLETTIAVLKRLRSSIKTWSKGQGSYGRQGYLNHVDNYID